jgi:RimJ/RimL family protein N-acetyltransferase
MLEAAMKSALHSGISTIHAEVHPENRASARMFEKAGFKPVKSADENMLRYEWHSAG